MPYSDWSDPITPTEENPFFDVDNPAATIRFSRSLSVQIMAMLSVFAAGCVPPQANRLGFLINANKQRSGKTLLVKICITPIYGSCKTQSWRENDEDMIKILDSETLAATSYICFDNIRSLIASAPLEGFMTAATWTGRILGRSEMFEADNNATLFFTANNASLGTDMQERTLICDLYVEAADRQDRGLELDPAKEIDDVWLARPDNRRRILSDLWAIVRHWDAAGRPLATGKPRKGFATWCRILGGMVEFAGFGDCLEAPLNLENCGDSETDDIRTLVEYASQDTTSRPPHLSGDHPHPTGKRASSRGACTAARNTPTTSKRSPSNSTTPPTPASACCSSAIVPASAARSTSSNPRTPAPPAASASPARARAATADSSSRKSNHPYARVLTNII